ncbi:hypothetical protein Tco_0383560 [Tanacetum coccineum]
MKYVKNQLCSSCEVSKAKRSSFKSKTVLSSKGRLNLLHMDLCGTMWVASINGMKYILKELSIKLLHLEHPNRTALSKDETALLLRLLERCFQLLNFIYSFGLKQLQPHAILKTDQSSSQLMRKWHITSLMTENPQLRHFTSVGLHLLIKPRDGENLDKMKEKGDSCILGGILHSIKGISCLQQETSLIVDPSILKIR